MPRPFHRLAWVGFLVALTACDQEMITIDSGDPSTLTVRAYVDGDGDGQYGSADVTIASATVTATHTDGTAVTGTTDGNGVATLELAPGSYTLSLAGSVPVGATLTTASEPIVAVPFQASSLSAEFRYAFQAGTIAGRLYRDDNASGEYEAGEDLAAAGITVRLQSSGADVDEVTTDADGQFVFGPLRPGGYTVVVELLETMDIEGGSTFDVTVGPGATTALPAVFTGTLRIDIAEARAGALGQTVSVEGVVTWHPSFDTRVIFLQDGTAGISVFAGSRPDAAIGDRVQITGVLSAFDGELQIENVASFVNLGPEGAPEPRSVTATEINAGMFQGELVTIDGTVEQVDVLSFDNQMVLLRDGGGETFAVKVDSRTGTQPDAWTVGETYAVTGVLGTDENESGTDIEDDHPHRIETRGPDDIVQGGSVVSIGDARAMAGETVVIRGFISWQSQWDDRAFFVQDGTGGLSVFFSGAPEMQRGDYVQIRGTIGAFRGEVQISPSDLEVLGSAAAPTPLGVTGAQINAGEFQGMLVTVTGEIQSIDALNFDNQVVILRDGAGTDLRLYVDSRTGVVPASWPAIGSTVRVTGVVGFDDRNQPEGMGPRIEPRDLDDIAMVTPGVTSMAEARNLPIGTAVTVQGTVTWQTPWDTRVYFFQDATGGMSTFHSGAPDLAVGDVVTLSGEVAAFRGELQIGGVTGVDVVTGGPEPTPRSVTGAQVAAGFFQGELVQASGTLLEVQVLSFGNQRVTIRDALGSEFAVFVDSRNGMEADAWPEVGTAVQVRGVLGFDNRDQPEGMGPRIETRSVDDLTVITPVAGG